LLLCFSEATKAPTTTTTPKGAVVKPLKSLDEADEGEEDEEEAKNEPDDVMN